MTTRLFIAVESFGPADGEGWHKYLESCGLSQLDELISLDSILCPSLLREVPIEYWEYVSTDSHCFYFFTDLAALRRALGSSTGGRLLYVVCNPPTPAVVPDDLREFKFVGYDLLEVGGSISALTNCGGWPGILDNGELSPKGLLESHTRALELRAELARRYPDEPHADCDVWAIFVADS